ncbi:D-aspartate oxidase-like [Chiloscyllium plagiosum]|uniref:D-aspartate oxidase-like n=1 Tax=Chiloscyllium plagiosum TaxID=36176 RepID=UPI001CB7B0E7|nr:D-aspartate oxidase-like [Chiloscyllium plagiosum]
MELIFHFIPSVSKGQVLICIFRQEMSGTSPELLSELTCQVSLVWGVLSLSQLKNAGGQLQTGKITGFWELHGKYEIIVNCSGIGARALTGDVNVYPVRGQIHKVHAPWLKHFVRVGDGTSYIYPGISSVTLGGTRQKDDWRMSVDPSDSEAIFKACCALEPSLQRAGKLFEGVGLRPVRAVLRLEKEKLEREGSHVYLVHNYGHGGTGVTFHWGTAKEAAQLVQECVTEIRCRPVRLKPKL